VFVIYKVTEVKVLEKLFQPSINLKSHREFGYILIPLCNAHWSYLLFI